MSAKVVSPAGTQTGPNTRQEAEGLPETPGRPSALLVYWLIRLFVGFLALLPRRLASFMCRSLAALVFLVDRKHRRIGLVNLEIAFPDRPLSWRRTILRRSFQQLGDLAVELSRLAHADAGQLRERVSYEPGRGLENYLTARDQQQGVLYLTAHLSAWEVLPLAHAAHGYPLSFVVRPLDNPYLERWVTGLRCRFGNQVVAKRGSLVRILKSLKSKGEVGLLIDQNIQEKEGVYAPLFGRPACTTSSLAALALKTGAPVVPGFIYPGRRPGDYRIRFYPPLRALRTGDHQRDLEENTAIYNRYIEEMVREFPHCWLWGHRRFKTQPDGADPYRRQ